MAMDEDGADDAVEVIRLLGIKGESWQRWHRLLTERTFGGARRDERRTSVAQWMSGNGTEQQRQMIALADAAVASVCQLWIARSSMQFHPAAIILTFLLALRECVQDVHAEKYPTAVDTEKLAN